MKLKLILSLILINSFFYATAQKSLKLFNGKNLDGWYIDVPAKDKNPDTAASFIIRDGKLVSMGVPKGHLITNSSFKNYQINLNYRFAGKPGNCGVLVHVSTPRVLYAMFPKSIEVQMQHLDAGDFWCIEENIEVPNMEERRGPKENWGVSAGKGRRIKKLVNNAEKSLGQWNHMTIECIENKITVWVNGILVNQGFNATASQGKIALQAEGSEVEFKNIKLTHVKPN